MWEVGGQERFDRVEGFLTVGPRALTGTCLCGRLSVGDTEELIPGINDAARPDQETSL